MKRLILMVAALTMAGCTSGPMRTGKICVTPVTSTGYSTADPIDIRPDVVLQVVNMLQSEMITQLGKEKNLSYTTDCAGADFVLITKLKSLDARSETHRGMFHLETSREYTMGVVAHLEDSSNKLLVANISSSHDGDNLTDAISDVAGDIIGEIRELPNPAIP